ncbi:hypothetical protein [Streptomyces aidingensis]|uniref:Tetratricopeptide repeat-containing protein n=1 Tax=Streptomyces aidingensis TaxID=910347 RepID=A0A1I1H8S8_9ACTN|nr:hypothetical protein [Streptomyces aidingensis]SFC20374.1 hypothetical protein SAMN05421773_102298 [Streptomyces aidingensis]
MPSARAGSAEFTTALATFRQNRLRLWTGMTLCRLSVVRLAKGEPEAAALAGESLSTLRGIGGDWRRATVLVAPGRARHAQGRLEAARGHWEEAFALFDELGHPDAREAEELLQGLGP